MLKMRSLIYNTGYYNGWRAVPEILLVEAGADL
jgi:hypothetical protein